MKINGESNKGTTDLNKDFNVHHTEIQFDTDEEWFKKIDNLKKELNIREKKLLQKVE